ncbi:MAG: AsmA family protein, partial [Bacteroidota bacterium]
MQPSESPDPIFQGTNFNAPPPGTPNMQTPGQPPKKRFRWLRKLVLWTIGIIGSLLLMMVVMAIFFDRQITQQLIVLVNKNLKTELKAEDASLSLLAAFPNASVNLSNVRLKDAQGGALLTAQELSFRFDLASLFGDQIKIHTVRIRDGAIRMVINAQGKTNTDIFKETKPAQPQTESKLQLGLEHAELQNMAVLYDNKPAKQTAELIVKQVNIAGNFSSKQYNLSTQAELKIIRIDTDSSRYLAGETVRYDAVLAVDVKKGLYDVQRMELSIGGNTFSVDGIAVMQTDFTDLNLKLTSQEGDISMIANLLPGQYHQYFRDFQSTGAYSCSGTLKGRVSKTDNPAIGFEVALRDGKVSSDKLQSPLRDVSFRARYNARPDGSGEFEIADFKGNFGGQPLGFNLKITNLNDPTVDFHCNGVIPLDGAYGLF